VKIICAVAMAGLAASSALAQNLVTNGDFNAGNTGFTSEYTYVAPATNVLFNGPGAYTVADSAGAVHNNWPDIAGQDGAGDNFLIVNGATSGNADVWVSNTIAVTQNTDYFFEAYATNICCNLYVGAGSALTFFVAGDVSNSTLATFTTTNAPIGAWQFLGNSWNSGNNTSVTLRLINASLSFDGNDFGVDTINFSTTSIAPAVPEPASWAMLITGFGLIGAAARRRRAIAA